ncbi:ATP-dependent 6-phosphofructokinase [Bullifex porci]|uniref:ATP-dependent 6-phosphofructokinase n=1 Tax=Bullifex porci TaxID=2606638 RepID=UPI0023F3E77F|nr:ATP-dependent 6-phosphofructokinase [Bullifex porci]MDD7255149.1 ATP-dependent 6-phosphofructokinase [Bullifex porci]MDY2740578.1 ATP-dependent 6-phosphofructokinase [Bullifex porci]
MKIGILTAGGDCPGLNAVIRGFAKYIYNQIPDAEIIGIQDGYRGLINGEFNKLKESDFSGILNIGGTILGTSRQPFKQMKVEDQNGESRLDQMVKNYKKNKLDLIVTLGGAGTHKTASLLSDAGCNVIGLPKTIDNDIWGTDVTFGFHTALEIDTECIDRIHTTAASHGRTMLVEIMGNKVGWLTLYSGIAGGADIILIPEIPYDPDEVCNMVTKRYESGKAFTIIAIAEGAMSKKEANMKKAERLEYRNGEATATNRLAKYIQENAGVETRTVVPGHIQRGGNPSPYDRLLSTELGSFAGKLVQEGNFGKTVAIINNQITYNRLADVAGKTKYVDEDNQMIKIGKSIGISFGDGKKFKGI